MFLNSVILILQEMLEASLLVSVMLALPLQIKYQKEWILFGIFLGIIGAYIYGDNIAQLSQWFDYVGQEIIYASMQLTMTLLLCVIAFSINRISLSPNQTIRLIVANAVLIALAVTREGSEIFVYLNGVINDPNNLKSTLAGGGIGIGIGVSIGIIFYYTISSLESRTLRNTGTVLLALIGGNMASQATLLLTQADWLAYTPQLWDSSGILSEHSLLGRLLYALVGYEATPSLLQLSGYLVTVFIIIICGYAARHYRGNYAHEQI